ncbi:Tripeptidyl-peptidase [Venturia inaequalis]|nr:Tripeptidyl-peptidase [Venturia inaequalis]
MMRPPLMVATPNIEGLNSGAEDIDGESAKWERGTNGIEPSGWKKASEAAERCEDDGEKYIRAPLVPNSRRSKESEQNGAQPASESEDDK